jgi:hypothetical protein
MNFHHRCSPGQFCFFPVASKKSFFFPTPAFPAAYIRVIVLQQQCRTIKTLENRFFLTKEPKQCT